MILLSSEATEFFFFFLIHSTQKFTRGKKSLTRKFVRENKLTILATSCSYRGLSRRSSFHRGEQQPRSYLRLILIRLQLRGLNYGVGGNALRLHVQETVSLVNMPQVSSLPHKDALKCN